MWWSCCKHKLVVGVLERGGGRFLCVFLTWFVSPLQDRSSLLRRPPKTKTLSPLTLAQHVAQSDRNGVAQAFAGKTTDQRARLAAEILAFCSKADEAVRALQGLPLVPTSDGRMRRLGDSVLVATAEEQVGVGWGGKWRGNEEPELGVFT